MTWRALPCDLEVILSPTEFSRRRVRLPLLRTRSKAAPASLWENGLTPELPACVPTYCGGFFNRVGVYGAYEVLRKTPNAQAT